MSKINQSVALALIIVLSIPAASFAEDNPIGLESPKTERQPLIFDHIDDYLRLQKIEAPEDLQNIPGAPQMSPDQIQALNAGNNQSDEGDATRSSVCQDYNFGSYAGYIYAIGDVSISPYLYDYWYAYNWQPTTFTLGQPASSVSLNFYYGGYLTAYDSNGNYLTQASVSYNYWGTPATVTAPAGTTISYVVAQSIYGPNNYFYTTNFQACYVSNQDPVAVAGADQSFQCVVGTQDVTLDGSGSYDADGDALNYTWTGSFGTAAGMNPTVTLNGGSHTITLTVEDGNGGSSSASINVDVELDIDAPAMNLLGAAAIQLECPAPFTDPGVDVTDCNTFTLSTSGSVGSALGTYTLTYTAVDAAGNSASISRDVVVEDTQAPAITLTGDNPVILGLYTDYIEAGFSVADACDPAPATSVSGAIDINVPGTYTLTYLATDAAGNSSSTTRDIEVINTAPEIINAISSFELSYGASDLSANFDLSNVFADIDTNDVLSYSFTNSNNDALTVTLTDDSLDIQVIDRGLSTISISATDNWGATTTGNFIVTVNTAPVLADAVLFAMSEIKIKKEVQILSGNVLVNDTYHTQSNDDDDDDDDDGDDDDDDDGGNSSHVHDVLKIEKDVFMAGGYALKADAIEIKDDATILSDVHANYLDNEGTIAGDIYTELETPQFSNLPPFQVAVPGTEDIQVNKNGSLTLPPGDYDEIKLKDRATLTLTGGVYNIRKLKAYKSSHIRFEEATELRISDEIKISKNAYVGPAGGSTIDASDIIFYITGNNGNGDDDDDDGQHGGGDAVKLEESVEFYGTIYAEAGKVELKKEVAFTGSILADRISIDKESILNYDGYFSNEDEGGVYRRVDQAWVEPEMDAEIPELSSLSPNYPNPFNPSTEIKFTLAASENVSLKVYDLRGSLVAELASGHHSAGAHSVHFAANGLSSGTYLYVLETPSFREVRRMVYLK